MNNAIQGRLSLSERQKIYLILVFVSLILLFYSIWQIKPVIIDVNSPLGLASHFTPSYWIGLALLLVASIFIFLDRELKKDGIFLITLITLGLFLLGVVVFAYQNPVSPNTYYPLTWVNTLLETHHLDISHSEHVLTYFIWPAFHFISASIMTIAGVGFGFVRYMPLLWIVCFVFIAYSLGKRLELPPNSCFLIAFLSFSSWIFDYAGYYYPRLPATLLLLLLFILLVTPKRKAAETIVIVLMFSALILSHGLTSLPAITGLIFLSIYRKEARFIALFIVMFGAWYMFQGFIALEHAIRAFKMPLMDILQLANVERYQVLSAPARLAARYSQLAYLALYAALMIGSAILLLRRRITGERRKQVMSLIWWSIGVALILFWGHGEASYRVFFFCILPAGGIIALSFSRRKLLIPLMCIFVVLSPLANYATDACWGQVLPSELSGTRFFALKVKPQAEVLPHDYYFYGYAGALVMYHDPNLWHIPHSDPQWIGPKTPDEYDHSLFDWINYILISKQGTDRVIFGWREDPYATWPQSEVGKKADLIYNNGYFQIYFNPKSLTKTGG